MFTIGPSNAERSSALPKKRSKPDEINQVDTTTGTEIKRVKSDSRVPEVGETPKTPKTPSPTISPSSMRTTDTQDGANSNLERTTSFYSKLHRLNSDMNHLRIKK